MTRGISEAQLRRYLKAQVDLYGLRPYARRKRICAATLFRFINGTRPTMPARTITKLGFEVRYVLRTK